MGYLKPVARQYREAKRRSERAAREIADRAARLATEHPRKTAATGILVGALAARAYSSHRAERARAAASARIREQSRGLESDAERSTSAVRVFVALDPRLDYQERIGMKNALAVGSTAQDIQLAFRSDARTVSTSSLVTAIVTSRCDELDLLIKKARSAKEHTIVAVHFAKQACALTVGEHWRSYNARVNGNVMTAHVYAPSSYTVLVDADDTFFACTLIRKPGISPVGRRIEGQNYFAGLGGSRLRADSVYACHLKARSLREALKEKTRDAGTFDRVFVVGPLGGWLGLAQLLTSHGIGSLGIRVNAKPSSESDVWIVKWNADVKGTLLVVVSPACGLISHKDLFLLHCMLHNLRESAQASQSDVRFTIGDDDARLLANGDVSPEGPRWTKTREIFDPFYESSPHLLKIGPLVIRGDPRLDSPDPTLAFTGPLYEHAKVAVFRSGGRLRLARKGPIDVLEVDVTLLMRKGYASQIYVNNGGVLNAAHAKRPGFTRLEAWKSVAGLDGYDGYDVYVPIETGGFGAGARRGARRRKRWV
jgi:hypothetical protein